MLLVKKELNTSFCAASFHFELQICVFFTHDDGCEKCTFWCPYLKVQINVAVVQTNDLSLFVKMTFIFFSLCNEHFHMYCCLAKQVLLFCYYGGVELKSGVIFS